MRRRFPAAVYRHGTEPDPEDARVLDTTLVLYADHTMNASTFTARVIASTLSDMFSAITGAVAALKGPLLAKLCPSERDLSTTGIRLRPDIRPRFGRCRP
jgi:hypothetical protein